MDMASMDVDSGNMAGMSLYGDTLYNAEGDDDDCKYHLRWTATPVCQGANVAFSLVLTAKIDGSLVTGADPSLEVFLNTAHPAPNSGLSQETSPGNYAVEPVQFDAAGQWTIRFHLFENCNDAPDSPHGHAAFYVRVP